MSRVPLVRRMLVETGTSDACWSREARQTRAGRERHVRRVLVERGTHEGRRACRIVYGTPTADADWKGANDAVPLHVLRKDLALDSLRGVRAGAHGIV